MKKEIAYKGVFKRGDIVVSENREFRLIIDVVNWNKDCLAYKWLPLKEFTITDVFGNSHKTEALTEQIQPTDIVEKHFHLYELE